MEGVGKRGNSLEEGSLGGKYTVFETKKAKMARTQRARWRGVSRRMGRWAGAN